MKKTIITILSVITVLCLFSGCQSTNKPVSKDNQSQAAVPTPVKTPNNSQALKKSKSGETLNVAQNGQVALINFAGSLNGVPFKGGTAKKFSLLLGSHSFIGTFEQQIIGHKIGDSFDVNVKFPDNYPQKNLAGKKAVFKVKLLGLSAPK